MMAERTIDNDFRRPTPKRIRVGQLGSPAALTPERLALLRSGIPGLVFPGFDCPLTDFARWLLLNRFHLPVIQEGHIFRPIGGLRLLSLIGELIDKDDIVVDVWDARILQQYPDFALQDALLTNLLFGLDARSAHDQLRKMHAALGKAGCRKIFKNASSRLGFEKEFGVNRRGALEAPEPKILKLATLGVPEDGHDE
jgi:hypothetical protein